MSTLSFREYLSTRARRYGPGRELFKTLLEDEDFTALDTREELYAYLARPEVSPIERDYARQVWHNYLIAKKRRSNGESP